METNTMKITFSRGQGFFSILKERVNDYFDERHLERTGDYRLHLKTGIILLMLVSSYVVLVFVADSLWVAIPAAVVLAQCLALVGFNIMHDANHGSYSQNPKVNWVMGFTLDLMGGSHFLWKQKHNVLHHTYTNIAELDEDLDTGGLLRLSPEQQKRPWHRFQHWYALPVYSMLTLSWVGFSDFHKFFTGRIGGYRIVPPTPTQKALFIVSKLFYVGVALVVPLFFHPLLHVVVAFLGIHLLLGLTLAIVFQLAHTVPGNDFPTPDNETGLIEAEWAIHEIQTTADFARNSRVASWYLGGLNFQIEHHLFPKVSHVHYPAISRIVESACREYGVSYHSYPSVLSAVRAHFLHLKTLGAKAA